MSGCRPAGDSDNDSDDYDDIYDANEHTGNWEEPETHPKVKLPEWRTKVFGSNGGIVNDKEFEGTRHFEEKVDKFRNALLDGHSEEVAEYMAAGVDPNQAFVGLDGGSPLAIACTYAYPVILDLLLSHDVSLVNKDEAGFTPIMMLCSSQVKRENYIQDVITCIEMLLTKHPEKLSVNDSQSRRMTPLMFAAKAGHKEVARYLLDKGANINAQDSQEWTALCFASDQGHGSVARILLDGGADPDLPTTEGLLASEIASSRGFVELQTLIETFSRYKSILSGQSDVFNKTETIKKRLFFSELDNILLGLNLGDTMKLFEKHNVNLEQFLLLDEEDLEKIGIDKVGDRKRILKGIHEIHKCDWEKSSLPMLTPKDRQKGLFLTCPDAITIVANMSNHLRYLSATLEYMKKQIEDHPEVLSLGQDRGNVGLLNSMARKCQSSMKSTQKRLTDFERVVKEHSRKDKSLWPADLIHSNAVSTKPTLWKTCFLPGVIASTLVITCFVLLRKK